MKTTTSTTFTVPGNISATFPTWAQPSITLAEPKRLSDSDAGCAYPPRECSRELRKAKAAVEQALAAADAWTEETTEVEFNAVYLRGEVEAVIASWWSWPVRRRLRRALEASKCSGEAAS